MEVRKANAKDISEVASLVVAIMAPEFKKVGEVFLTKDQYAEKLKLAFENMEFGVVLEDKNKIIGFAHWYYQDNQAFIEDLVIDPKYKLQIQGKALARFVMQTCKNDKIESVSLLLPHGSKSIEFMKGVGLNPISVELKKKL